MQKVVFTTGYWLHAKCKGRFLWLSSIFAAFSFFVNTARIIASFWCKHAKCKGVMLLSAVCCNKCISTVFSHQFIKCLGTLGCTMPYAVHFVHVLFLHGQYQEILKWVAKQCPIEKVDTFPLCHAVVVVFHFMFLWHCFCFPPKSY